MDRVLIAVFNDEGKAYRGCRMLRELDAEGVIEIHAAAVIARTAAGAAAILQPADPVPLGVTANLLALSLIKLLGDSPTDASSVSHDLARVGVGIEFTSEIGQKLSAGKSAVVADVWEDWGWPTDVRMEAAGGQTLRRLRKPSWDLQLERDAAALKSEMDELRHTRESVGEPGFEELKTRLLALRDRAQAGVVALTEEYDARILMLEARLVRARKCARPGFEARLADARLIRRRRCERLLHAVQLTQEALDG